MAYQRPKGTADILPGESEKWQYVEQTARDVFKAYQFKEIRTPMFENFDVFSRSVGDTSDIVTKEMYDFFDKGDRHIVLRPEGTAGVVRAYVENKLYGPEHQKPVKVYYMGPMFRYERPQSGRMREFHQLGVEAFGSESPAIDVETIAMALQLLKQFGLKDLKLVINTLGDLETRQAYRQALIDFLEPHFAELSADSKERLHKNPLRVLDSKDKHDQEIVKDAPSILDYLDETSTAHFTTVKQMLESLGIDYEIDANMVRGLDYYNHTIFEIMSNSKAFGGNYMTVCAGGRYNGLVSELGGPDAPGFGFGLGVERLLLIMAADEVPLPVDDQLDVYLVGIGAAAAPATLKLIQAIRGAGFSAERDYLDRKPKAQFKTANRLNAKVVITVGDSELAAKAANLKNMATGEETTVPFTEIESDFKAIFKTAVK
ncbi:histidine--tRNA ligase [Loigolactobacillus backii]|uniref:Histidine--tRNA ligase n=1 Tax=Loigolactobacillus backii TaxID=375175 RepID=A0A192H375_9LACO|nr:histidine--tRNA ligase [Loigolactobacillus backii]ANK59615.1 histidine--tRNA ligase [Loigolactobacillus backii]ANK62820.1 histidine--tRNA ligase [Loigolactobacillus backii]ANK64609.1 histidine--tRNA ligase [Loigolactobacillus backii]ANK66995.1 histidine--tRNA ligase [Loigolactobacillus backii]ANK70172.1 histidine--tRNA ligase [Loigolactobacillus backii]